MSFLSGLRLSVVALGLVVGGCSAVYPELQTPVRSAEGRALEAAPAGLRWVSFKGATVPSETRDGRKWGSDLGRKSPDPYAVHEEDGDAAGTAIPQRADFNTLDNPFAWSADGSGSGDPAAGVHFVVFNPTSDDFHRVRNAMDGVLPDGTTLQFEPRAEGQGFNSILRTTRRQNFLVPPRAHRSFPLSEA